MTASPLVWPAEVPRARLLAPEKHGHLVRERHARETDRRAWRVLVVRLLDVREVRAHVLVRDHLGDRQHLHVAAGVVVVLVRVDHVAQRLVRYRLHLREDVAVIAVEHVVDEHDPLVCREHRDVSTFAGDHMETGLDLRDAQRPGWFGVLCVDDPRAGERGDHEKRKQGAT